MKKIIFTGGSGKFGKVFQKFHSNKISFGISFSGCW
tara:strand:- start:8 stop:115 length:108 start_codon:yes stop_codon:yes gene_type:complete